MSSFEKLPLTPSVVPGETKSLNISISSMGDSWNVNLNYTESNHSANPQTNKTVSQTYQVNGSDAQKIASLQQIGIAELFELGE